MLCTLSFLLVPDACAQAGSGDVIGAVRDASGAVVAGARVSLTKLDTLDVYASATSDGGVLRHHHFRGRPSSDPICPEI